MYSKARKTYAPGTFIPTPARVLAILQLCLAFTCVLWYLGYPFMGEHFERKTRLLQYEHVLGDQERFARLPSADQSQILKGFEALQPQSSFIAKIKEGFAIFFVRIPKFELIWVLLAITISLGLLKKREGAVAGAWLLPIVALAFAADNIGSQAAQPLSAEQRLFPTEKEIVENYLQTPLSSHVLKQREQLLQGWQFYLIREWAHEAPSPDPEVFARQAAEGDFAFSIERLKRAVPDANPFRGKQSPFFLAIYVAWNFFFAGYMTYKVRS